MSAMHRPSWRMFVVLAAAGAVLNLSAVGAAGASQSVAPLRAGEVSAIDVRAGFSKETAVLRVVSHPGASVMFLHFQDLVLAPGVELVISDAEREVSHTYPGADFSFDTTPGRWALGLPGDTAVVELRVADPSLGADLTLSGFVIDRYGWGYPGGGGVPETVCGAEDRRDVECYHGSHPTEFERSRAVARHYRIESPYVYLCTAWRVGPGDTMFTNQHCLEQPSWLTASQFHFNYERVECDGTTNKPMTAVTGNQLLFANWAFDFALFTINNPSAVESFGYLELDIRTPVLGEEIYMAGHPDGDPKIFALESDFNTGGLCVIDDAIRNGNTSNSDTGYYCDTSGGQSGSPVLARSSHKVIALHHFGTATGVPCGGDNMNAGVRIDRIWPYVAAYLPWLFEDGFESGDTSAWSATVP